MEWMIRNRSEEECLYSKLFQNIFVKLQGKQRSGIPPYNRLSGTNGTVAHNFHDKTKNLTAKPKTSRQNQIHSKNHANTSWPKPIPTAKPIKAILLLLWSIWFRRDVFVFAARYFVFAVRFLVLPWCFCFCREVFGFAVTIVGYHTKRKWCSNGKLAFGHVLHVSDHLILSVNKEHKEDAWPRTRRVKCKLETNGNHSE